VVSLTQSARRPRQGYSGREHRAGFSRQRPYRQWKMARVALDIGVHDLAKFAASDYPPLRGRDGRGRVLSETGERFTDLAARRAGEAPRPSV
jgi:hypothetical protein